MRGDTQPGEAGKSKYQGAWWLLGVASILLLLRGQTDVSQQLPGAGGLTQQTFSPRPGGQKSREPGVQAARLRRLQERVPSPLPASGGPGDLWLVAALLQGLRSPHGHLPKSVSSLCLQCLSACFV